MRSTVRIVLIAVIVAFGLTFIGCTGDGGGKKLKLGVIHLVSAHPDHILLREVFVQSMKEKGYDVDVTVFDANSNQYPTEYTTRAAKEAEKMEADGVKLIYATATYHGIAQGKTKIPVIDSVFIAPDILGLSEKKDGKMFMKGNATGIMFGYPFKDIVNMARALKPGAGTIAYIYNPKSPISRPLAEFKDAAAKVGLAVADCPFTTKDEALKAIKAAQNKSQIAFGTNDLAVLGVEKEAMELAKSIKFPVIVGVVPLVDIGAIAAIQYDWKRSAKMCADKANQVLSGTAANTIPVEFADAIETGLNLKVIKDMGLKISPEWVEAATKVVDK